MSEGDPIWKQIAEPFLRKSVHDELGEEMQVGAWIEIVRDAGGDDAEDGCGAFAADVEPGEEPIFSAETEPAQLTLASVIGELDVTVFEEKGEA